VAEIFRRRSTPVASDVPPVDATRRQRNAAVPERRRHSQLGRLRRRRDVQHVSVGKAVLSRVR